MIPQVQDDLKQDFEITELPSKSFRLDAGGEVVSGFVDNAEAMKQVIFLILNVERYQYIIHSWKYGFESVDLYGKPIAFVLPEIKRRITEALIQDDRITGVENFEFTVTKGRVHVTFQVNTIFGAVQSEKEVEI